MADAENEGMAEPPEEYSKVICFVSEDVACLERNDLNEGMDIVEISDDKKDFKVVFRLDRKVQSVVPHGDRLIIDSMIFRFKEDGQLTYI